MLLAVVAIGLLVVAVVLFLRFWRLRKQLESLGGNARFAFWGAVVYTVFPVDALPDPIVLDDIGVLAAATLYLNRLIRERDARRDRRPGRPDRPVPAPDRRAAGRRRP